MDAAGECDPDGVAGVNAQPRLTAAAFRKGVGRPLERAVQVKILRWLRANVGDVVFHPHNAGLAYDAAGGSRQRAEGVTAGVSDLIGIVETGPLAGRFFAVEVKRPGATASEIRSEQLRFGRMVEERGGLFVLATSVEEVEAWARRTGIVRPCGWRAPWVAEPERHAL